MKKSALLLILFLFGLSGWTGIYAETEAQQQEARKLTGVIVDELGERLVGVSVSIPGTGIGSTTNIDGEFSINFPKGATKIEVAYLGYKKVSQNVGPDDNSLRITLVEDTKTLDEVVVIGYGTARKRDLTGAISQIKAEKLEAEAPRSVQDLLRANAAGLNIGMATSPKGDAGLQIRGKNSLRSGNDEPLIVMDGVIYAGSLSDINPMDVQSVDVLKDASSSAVYGAKAANGVVVIITKKGSAKGGKPLVSFNANVGVVTVASQPELLSPDGFLAYRQDYEVGKRTDAYLAQYPQMFTDPRKLNGVDPLTWYNYDIDPKKPATSYTEEQLIRSWLSRLELKAPETQNYLNGKTTDWANEVFQNGIQQDYTASISNKKDDVSYYWSLGYVDREGIVTNERYKTFRTRLNLESKVTDFLTIGLNSNFASKDDSYLRTQNDDNSPPGGNLTADWEQMTRLSPYASNEIGVVDSPYQRLPTGDPTPVNPFYDAMYRDRKNMTSVIDANLYAIIKLPFGIEYQFNYFPHLQFEEMYNHESSKNENWKNKGGESLRRTNKEYDWQIDNLIRWKREFNKLHKVELTLLQNAEQRQNWSQRLSATGFVPSDILGYHRVQAGASPSVVTSDDNYATGDALMARLFYAFNDKYMVTASVRQDGYSAFGQENPRAVFPAVALGWVFTSEDFMKSTSNWFNYGKLRLSWGENGNRSIGQYDALSDMTSGLHPYISQAGVVYTTSQLYVNRMANPALQWERTEAYNLGLDFSLFGDMLSGSFEGYLSHTNDLLVDRALPEIIGFNSVKTNLGQIQNKGFEASLTARPIKNENFQWSMTGTFSLNRREITKLYGDMVDVKDANGNVIGQKEADDVKNKWFIGHDSQQIWDWKRVGVWQKDEAALAAKYGCQPGDFKYQDQQAEGEVGYGVMNDDDKVFMDYKTPRFRWSFRNEINFLKNFSFSFMLYSYWGQHDTFNRAANNSNFPDRCTEYVQPRWTSENPINDYARIGSKNIGNNYVDKSFIRLDNVALSYFVPKSLLKKVSVQDMRFSATIRNIGTWAPHWNFWDPEQSEPLPRTFNLGVNFTL